MFGEPVLKLIFALRTGSARIASGASTAKKRLKNRYRQTHGVKALNVADVLVCKKSHLSGHSCHAPTTGSRDERHGGG